MSALRFAGDRRLAWRRAVELRETWLAHGLSTKDADRAATESSITAIYARLRRAGPRFSWVDSPAAALPMVRGFPTHEELHRWVYGRRPPGSPPLASTLAAALSRLRGDIEAAMGIPFFDPPPPRKRRDDEPALPPELAIEAGRPFRGILRQGVRDVLAARLGPGLAWPVRSALAAGGPVPVHWYGQHDAGWVAHLDVIQRLGLAPCVPAFDDWATLARSAGWWWPGEELCVVVERPVSVEPVEYRDGWRPYP
jgi:uncharacterized protein DUF6745